MDKIKSLELNILKLLRLKEIEELQEAEKELKELKRWKYQKNDDGTYTLFTHGVFGKENLKIVDEIDTFLANRDSLKEFCNSYYYKSKNK